ncbi:unnamed protein product, partial [Prorocentrum cordatum]
FGDPRGAHSRRHLRTPADPWGRAFRSSRRCSDHIAASTSSFWRVSGFNLRAPCSSSSSASPISSPLLRSRFGSSFRRDTCASEFFPRVPRRLALSNGGSSLRHPDRGGRARLHQPDGRFRALAGRVAPDSAVAADGGAQRGGARGADRRPRGGLERVDPGPVRRRRRLRHWAGRHRVRSGPGHRLRPLHRRHQPPAGGCRRPARRAPPVPRFHGVADDLRARHCTGAALCQPAHQVGREGITCEEEGRCEGRAI